MKYGVCPTFYYGSIPVQYLQGLAYVYVKDGTLPKYDTGSG